MKKAAYIFILLLFTPIYSYANSEIIDPYEKSNRIIHNFNDKIDVLILRPVSVGYSILPNPLEEGISNLLQNISEPINFTNFFFQGEIEKAFKSISRFLINSTIGLIGLIDVADKMNLEKNNTDFGFTLKSWGVKEGPYLVVPFFGPRSTRHLTGSIIDMVTNPLNYILKDEDSAIRISPSLLYAVSSRSGNMETIDNLRETSIDYYSSLKSIYIQNRFSKEINEGNDDMIDDFFQSLEEENINE